MIRRYWFEIVVTGFVVYVAFAVPALLTMKADADFRSDVNRPFIQHGIKP